MSNVSFSSSSQHLKNFGGSEDEHAPAEGAPSASLVANTSQFARSFFSEKEAPLQRAGQKRKFHEPSSSSSSRRRAVTLSEETKGQLQNGIIEFKKLKDSSFVKEVMRFFKNNQIPYMQIDFEGKIFTLEDQKMVNLLASEIKQCSHVTKLGLSIDWRLSQNLQNIKSLEVLIEIEQIKSLRLIAATFKGFSSYGSNYANFINGICEKEILEFYQCQLSVKLIERIWRSIEKFKVIKEISFDSCIDAQIKYSHVEKFIGRIISGGDWWNCFVSCPSLVHIKYYGPTSKLSASAARALFKNGIKKLSGDFSPIVLNKFKIGEAEDSQSVFQLIPEYKKLELDRGVLNPRVGVLPNKKGSNPSKYGKNFKDYVSYFKKKKLSSLILEFDNVSERAGNTKRNLNFLFEDLKNCGHLRKIEFLNDKKRPLTDCFLHPAKISSIESITFNKLDFTDPEACFDYLFDKMDVSFVSCIFTDLSFNRISQIILSSQKTRKISFLHSTLDSNNDPATAFLYSLNEMATSPIKHIHCIHRRIGYKIDLDHQIKEKLSSMGIETLTGSFSDELLQQFNGNHVDDSYELDQGDKFLSDYVKEILDKGLIDDQIVDWISCNPYSISQSRIAQAIVSYLKKRNIQSLIIKVDLNPIPHLAIKIREAFDEFARGATLNKLQISHESDSEVHWESFTNLIKIRSISEISIENSVFTEDVNTFFSVIAKKKYVTFNKCAFSNSALSQLLKMGFSHLTLFKVNLIGNESEPEIGKALIDQLLEQEAVLKRGLHLHYLSKGGEKVSFPPFQLQSVVEKLRRKGVQSLKGDFCEELLENFPVAPVPQSPQDRVLSQKFVGSFPDDILDFFETLPQSPLNGDLLFTDSLGIVVEPEIFDIDLPDHYQISNRYTCGPVLSADTCDVPAAQSCRALPTCSLSVLAELKGSSPYSTIAIRFDGLEGRLLTVGTPLSEKSEKRVTFVYAGRGEEATVPIEEEGGVVVLVCAAAQELAASGWVSKYRDVLVVDKVSGADEGQEGLVSSRRLAVLRYTYALGIRDYMVMDDNIEHLYVSPNLLTEQASRWKNVYNLFQKTANESGAIYLSARTFRPNYQSPDADAVTLLEENAIGSKIGFFSNAALCQKASKDQLALLLPRRKDVWGGDVWLWRAFCRLGMEARLLHYNALCFSRVHGGAKEICAQSLSKKAAYWLQPETNYFYNDPAIHPLEKAVYWDMRQIVENDKNARINQLLSFDSLSSSDRTEKRLSALKSYSSHYHMIVKRLFRSSANEENLLEILKEQNGRFGLGLLPRQFFNWVEQWLEEEWKGEHGALATSELKIRLVFEAVIYLGYNLDCVEENFENYQIMRQSIVIPKKISELYKMFEQEPKARHFISSRLPSMEAQKTFLRFKEMETETTARESRPPFSQKTVETFVVSFKRDEIAFEVMQTTFDNEQRMIKISACSSQKGFDLLASIGVNAARQSSGDGTEFIIVSGFESREKLLDYFMAKGMKINGEDVLLLPTVSTPQAKPLHQENPTDQNRPPQKRRKIDDRNLRQVSHNEVLGLKPLESQSSSSSSAAIPASASSAQPSSFQTYSFILETAGFLQGAIASELKKARNALLKQKELCSTSAIAYSYADKIGRILYGDVALEENESCYLLGRKMKDYQKESVDAAELSWKAGLNGFLLASDMGTGKTLVMLELMFRAMMRNEKVLLIAPDAILGQLQSQVLTHLSIIFSRAVEREHGSVKEGASTDKVRYAQMEGLKAALVKLQRNIDNSGLLTEEQKREVLAETNQSIGSIQESLNEIEAANPVSAYTSNIAPLDARWVKNPLILSNPFSLVKTFKHSPASIPGTITITTTSGIEEKIDSIQPDLVVIDEASKLHNRKSKLCGNFIRAFNRINAEPKVLLVTGTPLENALTEFTTLIQLLISSEERSQSEFAEQKRFNFRSKAQSAFEEAEQLLIESNNIEDEQLQGLFSPVLTSFVAEEVFKYVTRHLFYRVAKREDKVLQAFEGAVPREIIRKKTIELNNNHLKAVEECYLLYKERASKKTANNFFEIFSMARVLLVHPIFEQWKKTPAKEYNHKAKELCEQLKNYSQEEFQKFIHQSALLKAIVEDLENEEAIKNGPSVLFVENIAVGHILNGIIARKYGQERTAFMFGEVSSDEKTKMQNNFKNGSLDAIILTYKTGGMGLDLKNGKALLVVEKPFNPGLELQAKARINRVGQGNEVAIYEYHARSSVSEHLEAIHRRKKWLFSYVFNEQETENHSVVADHSLLNAQNFRGRLERFFHLLVSMKDFKQQLNRNTEILDTLMQHFLRLSDSGEVIRSFNSASPFKLSSCLQSYSIHPLPLNERKEKGTFHKVIAAYSRMRRYQWSLRKGTAIPQKWYASWSTWVSSAEGKDLHVWLGEQKLQVCIYSETGEKMQIPSHQTSGTIVPMFQVKGENGNEYRLLQEK